MYATATTEASSRHAFARTPRLDKRLAGIRQLSYQQENRHLLPLDRLALCGLLRIPETDAEPRISLPPRDLPALFGRSLRLRATAFPVLLSTLVLELLITGRRFPVTS